MEGTPIPLSELAAEVAALLTPPTLATVAAAGANQATATRLTATRNVVTSGTGGVLVSAGLTTSIWNRTGAAILVYPEIGAQIENYGTNAPFSLPNGESIDVAMTAPAQGYAG